MKIDEALEEFDFFNEGDYITREMAEAKDIVLQELENTRADLYEVNNRITDLLLTLGDRDKIIDDMAEHLTTSVHSKEWVIKYFEERCKNAKD